MFHLNEDELQDLSKEIHNAQLQLKQLEKFTKKIRRRSKISNPIKLNDYNTFSKNLEILLLIKDTKNFKERCIEYFLNNLFKDNISFMDILTNKSIFSNKTVKKQKIFDSDEQNASILAAIITNTIIQNYSKYSCESFPLSLGIIIVSYLKLDTDLSKTLKLLNINQDVKLLFDRMRLKRDFSDNIYNIFIHLDRKLFVPEHEKSECNTSDRPISLNYGISLSAPHIHIYTLKQFEYLFNINNDNKYMVKFLDVGCGSGYIASLITIGFILNNTNQSYFKTYATTYNDNLYKMCIKSANKLNFNTFLEYKHSNIDILDIGWKENAPFTGIYCGAAITENDCLLLRKQLQLNGYLMCVVEDPNNETHQTMKLIKRIALKPKPKPKPKPKSVTDDIKDNNDDNNKMNPLTTNELNKMRVSKLKKLLIKYIQSNNSLDFNDIFKYYNYKTFIEKNQFINAIIIYQNNHMIIDQNKQQSNNDDNMVINSNNMDVDNYNKTKTELEKVIEAEKLNDECYKVTDFIDVRFRTLRGRFKYLNKKDDDNDDDDDSGIFDTDSDDDDDD